MQTITRNISREVNVSSSIEGWESADWIVTITPTGLKVRRKGKSVVYQANWKQIIGTLVLHG